MASKSLPAKLKNVYPRVAVNFLLLFGIPPLKLWKFTQPSYVVHFQAHQSDTQQQGRTLAVCFSSWPTCRFSRLFGLSIAGAGAIALKRSTPWVVVLLSERTRALENARDCQARFSALSHHVSRILRFWERTLIKSVEHPKTHAWNLVITVFKKPQVNKVKYRPNLSPNFEPKVSPKWA